MPGGKTLDLTIRIAGKMDRSLLAAVNGTKNRVSDLARTVSGIGTAGLAAMGALTTGTVAAIADCANEAATFENQMSNVVKYVDGLADAGGRISESIWEKEDGGNGKAFVENYAAMKDAILDLSTQIPYTAEDLTRLAAAAGQSGKSMEEITGGFLKDAAMWGAAMDISADQAGDWAAKWEMAFDKDHDQIMTLANQINYLGANNATTAAEIAQVVNDAASLGQVAGIDPDATAAMGTAMLAMGVDAGKAATSIKRIYTQVSKGSSATKAMKEQWKELGFTAEGVAKSMQEDGVGTMESIFRAIDQLPEERQVAALSTLFGQWAIEGGAKIVGNLNYYADVMDSVTDPENYKGSMMKEFIIKSETPEAVDLMMSNAFKALKIDVGTAFLPAKKDVSLALIGFINQLRDMPELGEIAGKLAELFSQGVQWAGDALENALPSIKDALDYLLNHGPQVVGILKTLAGTFAAMKFAPGIAGLLGGAGDMLLGTKSGRGSYTARTGGLSGMVSGLFQSGQSVGTAAAGLASGVVGASRENGIGAALSALASGLLSGNGVQATAQLLQTAAGTPGMLSGYHGPAGVITGAIANTGIGQYVGNVGTSMGNFLNATGISGAANRTLGAGGEILSGIAQATGLANVLGIVGGGLSGAGGWIAGKASGLAGTVINSAPAQAIGGITGNAGNVLASGAGLLGSVWGPAASGFGGLLSGALPIVGAVSGIIAVVSLLGDNLDGVGNIVQSVFGEEGLAVFDKFRTAVEGIGTFLNGLFQDGGANRLREAIFGTFDDGNWQGGLLSNLLPAETIDMLVGAFNVVQPIIQSVLGVIGQIVDFSVNTVKPIIQEIFSFITGTVMPIILQTFTEAVPIIAGIISNTGAAVMAGMQIVRTAIQAAMPIIEGIITAFLSIASVVIPAVLTGFEIFSAGISSVMNAAQTIFQGIIDFITGIFTQNWSDAFEGLKNIVKGVFDAIAGIIETPIKAVSSVIDKAAKGIGSLFGGGKGNEKSAAKTAALPAYAKGGFTTGPSIAGEAGVEAVISFQRSERARNIDTWARAGEMLGVTGGLADMGNRPVELPELPANARNGNSINITFAPQVTIQGNADRGTVDKALMESEQRIKAWMEANFGRFHTNAERERGRRAY